MKRSISSNIRNYIVRHPSIRECMRRNLINYSALAREMCREAKIPVTKAAVMAASRHGVKMRSQRSQERQLDALLRKAKINVKARMLVAGIRRAGDYRTLTALQSAIRESGDDLTVVEGQEMMSLATSARHAALVKAAFKGKIHTLVQPVAQIVIATDPKAMYVVGLSGYVLHRIAAVGINVLEEYTCGGEQLIIVEDKDLPTALSAFQF